MKFMTSRPCRYNSYVVYPSDLYDLPLEKIAGIAAREGYRASSTGTMVEVDMEGTLFVLYRTGRLLISPCSSSEEAYERGMNFFSMLEKRIRLDTYMLQEGLI